MEELRVFFKEIRRDSGGTLNWNFVRILNIKSKRISEGTIEDSEGIPGETLKLILEELWKTYGEMPGANQKIFPEKFPGGNFKRSRKDPE